jgi:hypothetical protein
MSGAEEQHYHDDRRDIWQEGHDEACAHGDACREHENPYPEFMCSYELGGGYICCLAPGHNGPHV